MATEPLLEDEDMEEEDLEVVEDSDVEDTDDGGAIVTLESPNGESEVLETEEFYENLVPHLDQDWLSKLSLDLQEKIELDKHSREKRVKEYAEALKRTGLSDQTIGGAEFEGASKVVHPILIEGVIDYAARAVSELIPPEGPVKMAVVGEATKAREDKAKRKAAYMNWQLKHQIKEFKHELEQTQSQEALAGNGYIRLVFDSTKDRPVMTFIPVDKIYLPFAASDFYSAERRTWAEDITQIEFEERIAAKLYVFDKDQPADVDPSKLATPPAQAPEESEAETVNDSIEGREPTPSNEDGERVVFLTDTTLWIEKDNKNPRVAEKRPAPYLVSIDKETNKVVSIVRNWEEDDPKLESMDWIIEFPFIPWRGAYAIGLNQVMAGVPAALTGALRALLDSGHINNLPGLVKLKGANTSGQSVTVGATQIIEIEGGIIGAEDIRRLLMAIPYNPPSTVLYSLMGYLTETGKGVVRTTFDNLAEQNPQLPATTAMALIEQGMKVMSAIHLRQWTALDKLLQVLHRINRLYTTDEQINDETGSLLAYRSDFQGPLDCIPTADPQVFSDAQRFAQVNMVAGRAQGNPLYNQRKVEELLLERTRIPNAKDLLIPEQVPKDMNAVNENVAMTFGRPVAAFPEQDHLAHIQTLLDFGLSPVLGQLSIIMPKYWPAALEHLKEHIVMWYVEFTYQQASKETQQPLEDLMKESNAGSKAELDRLLTVICKQATLPQAQKLFAKLPEILAQIQQKLQEMMPQPQMLDPAQASLQKAQLDNQTKVQLSADKMQQLTLVEDRKDQREARNNQSDLEREQMEQQAENERTILEVKNRRAMNQEDNATAMILGSQEIQDDGKTQLTTGTGIDPQP